MSTVPSLLGTLIIDEIDQVDVMSALLADIRRLRRDQPRNAAPAQAGRGRNCAAGCYDAGCLCRRCARDAPARSAAVSAEGPLPRLPYARRQSPVRPLLLFTTLAIAAGAAGSGFQGVGVLVDPNYAPTQSFVSDVQA